MAKSSSGDHLSELKIILEANNGEIKDYYITNFLILNFDKLMFPCKSVFKRFVTLS